MEITLLSQLFTVIECDPLEWNLNAMGRSSLKKGRILLDQSLPEEIKMATLMHEIVHQFADINDLPIRENETTISVLANSLFDFLRRNQGVARRIMGVKDDYQNTDTEDQKMS